MTEYQLKRLNENWSALPQALQDLFRKIYSCEVEYGEKLRKPNNEFNDFANGRISMLESLFGSHTLTVQVEEKPNEPKFNIGEKVRINCYSNGEVWDAVMHNKIVTIQDYYVKDGVNMYVLKEGCRDFGEHCLEPYIEPKANVKTSDENDQKSLNSTESGETSTKADAYFKYRLDLAKEIAVAMIDKWSIADFIPYDSVQMANEIVKRLKETDNENA